MPNLNEWTTLSDDELCDELGLIAIQRLAKMDWAKQLARHEKIGGELLGEVHDLLKRNFSN